MNVGNARRLFLCALVLAVAACAVNPVTGKRELHLVSEAQEIQMGAQSYVPAQQSQGGDYVLDPALVDYVRGVGEKLAKASDRPELPYDFVVLNNSVPNAWAMPGGKIAVNRGLLTELDSEGELAAVLGHEIVHAAARHGAQTMERGMLFQAGLLGLGVAVSNRDNAQLLVGAASMGLGLVNLKYGRDAESEADHYGMIYMARAGYDPKAAVSLQETFVRLFEGKRANWLEGLFASHPPSQARVDANRVTAITLPPGGIIGREEYHARIAGVIKDKSAYDKLDEGYKALAKKDSTRALALAEEGIKLAPREALLYGLRGDAKAQQDKFKEALADYDQAIQRNGDYFQFYLQRGLARQELHLDGARQDLEKSVSLLPTATAHSALGDMAAARGDKAAALTHYNVAAESNTATGHHAALEMAKLELPAKPEKYIAAAVSRDGKGMVVITVRNRAPVKVRRVAVAVALIDNRGRILDQETVYLPWALNVDSTGQITTHLGPLASDNDLRNIRVQVEAADVVD